MHVFIHTDVISKDTEMKEKSVPCNYDEQLDSTG